MVDHDPAERLKIDDVLHHPTFYTPQRKLNFLLTVRESLEKCYRNENLNDPFQKKLSEIPQRFNLKKTFRDHQYMMTPLSKQTRQEQEQNINYKGGWKPIGPKYFGNLLLVLRTLRNFVVHACDSRNPEEFKKDFGVKDDFYDPKRFFDIFVAKHNLKLLISLYNAYKNNGHNFASKFYSQT